MEDDGDDDGDFTFAVSAPLAGSGGIFPGGRIGAGRLYPVFGRQRSPPRRRAPEQEPETTTATACVPLGRVLLVDRGRAAAAQPPDGGKPAKTCYCSWCPGLSSSATPARCRKSGSTGSLLRWSQRLLGRSHSDGKEKFVFLDAASTSGSERKERGSGHVTAWSYYAKAGAGARGSCNGAPPRRSFLPYRQGLVGIFASTTAFRRSYHPF